MKKILSFLLFVLALNNIQLNAMHFQGRGRSALYGYPDLAQKKLAEKLSNIKSIIAHKDVKESYFHPTSSFNHNVGACFLKTNEPIVEGSSTSSACFSFTPTLALRLEEPLAPPFVIGKNIFIEIERNHELPPQITQEIPQEEPQTEL